MSANPKGLKKSYIFPVLIIATLAIGLYLNTLKNGFVYDDVLTVVNNTFIKSFDNLPLLFDKTAYFSHSEEMSYRPVVTVTYFIDYALYGLKSWGYHLTNILLHGINGALLYIFLTLLLTPSPSLSRLQSLPFLISLLFVSHPVLTEAVNCISYREDLLAFLFYIATLSLYLILRQPTSDHRPLTTVFLYLLSCLAYLLALLSKEMAVTLPLIIICYEWLYGKDKMKLPSRLFNPHIIGYITITLFYLYLRFYLFYNLKEQIQAWSLVERFFTIPWVIVNYLRLSIIPAHLSADYVINPVSSPFSPIFFLPVIALVSIFTYFRIYDNPSSPSLNKGKQKRFPLLVKGGEGGFESIFWRRRSVLFGALFFLITLTPVYNLVPIVNPFAERYLYLPVAGFIVFAVLFTCVIAKKSKAIAEYRNRYVPMFFLGMLIIFSFSVVKRNTIWRDDISLWSDTVVKTPDSARAHYSLGYAYNKHGRYDEAIQAYLTALRLKPDYVDAYNNLGIAYYNQGRLDEAIQAYLTSLRQKPEYAEAYNNLGIAYYDHGRYEEAIQAYLTALRLNPDYVAAYNSLGNAYSDHGRYDEAIQAYLAALRLKPDYVDAYNNLGTTYYDHGRYDEAIQAYLTALRLKPDYAEAYNNLGLVYLRQDLYDKAKNEFTIALKLKPDFKEAYRNLEVVHMEKKKSYKDSRNVTSGQDN